jgi:HEAT repeat protein
VVAVAALGSYVARQSRTAAPSVTEAAPLVAAVPASTPISIPIIAAPAAEVAKLPTERGTVASASAVPVGGNSVAVRIGSLSQSPAADKKPAETAVPPAPKAEVKGENPPAQSSRVAIKRRQTRSEEELRKDLRRTPEVPSFTAEQISRLLMTHGQHFQVSGQLDFEPRALLETRPDLQSLPVRHGRAGQVDAWTAANLQTFARKLHFLVDRVVPKEKDGSHVQPVLLHEFMHQEIRGKRPSWLRPEAIPALQQILAHEDKAIRWLLVELLAEIPGPAASIALAQRAMYDFSPELRDQAIEALKNRPPEQYRHVLLGGLRYPWPPAADHAAEALVALDDKAAVSNLIALLKMLDPSRPFQTSPNHTFVRELARINHQSNCLMCHAPAVTKGDPVIAAVPGFFTSAVSFSPTYGAAKPKVYSSPLWLRADVTYLRQDFSVHDTVGSAGANPGLDHRFDYLVRTRICKRQERDQLTGKPPQSTYPQREAVVWALRQLTGKDAGSMAEDWAKLFPRAELDVEAAQLSAKLARAKGAKQAQLLAKFKDQEGVVYTQALAGAIPRLKGTIQQQARQALAERLSRMTVDTLRGRLKDDDAEIRRAAAVACALKAKDDLVPDLLDLLEDSESAVVQAAQTALQRLTGREIGAGG